MSTLKLNVRFGLHQETPPLVRELLRFKITNKKDGKWLHWYWKQEPKVGEAHTYDCGFSGLREDHQDFNRIQKELKQALPG